MDTDAPDRAGADDSGDQEATEVSEDAEHYDDDALAAAMADEAERLGLTGAIQTMAPPTSPAVSTPLPPPVARAVAAGPRAPNLRVQPPAGPWPSARPPSGVPIPPATAGAMPDRALAGAPAPTGAPVVFEIDAPPGVGVPLPTRRSLRDAELARTREEHQRRMAAPNGEGARVPDFSPAPSAPEAPGGSGDRSPVSTPVSAPAVPRVYDLIEPQPYSAPPLPPLGSVPAADDSPALTSLPSEAGAWRAAEADAAHTPHPTVAEEEAPPSSLATSPWLHSAAIAVVDTDRRTARAWSPEPSGSEPTPLDRRLGRAARLFWLWFAANSSVLSLAFGAAIFSLGMSLRQAVVAIFVGVSISFLPMGLGTLAGKWSGQPVMVVSRATFGHLGNRLPAAIALLSRLFWGAVLLWMIGAATARILVGSQLNGSLTELQLLVIVMAAGFLLALLVAFFGYALFARLQLGLGIVSAVLIAALVAITWPAVDFSTALTVADGPVILVVTGVVLVFSFVGLVWATSSGDLARYQRPSSSGGASMLWASFGTTLPAFLLIGYGAVLAASSASTARGLVLNPLDTIAGFLPGWYPVPLIAATVLSLLSGVILSIYSGGFALGSLGLQVSRSSATVIVGVLVFVVAVALGITVSSVVTVFRDLATTIAVPVAAWAGIFAAEMILRRRRFDTASLVSRGGVYRDVNWPNLVMLVVASAVGLGFTSATVVGLGWEGYLFGAVGIALSSPLGGTDVGVLVALVLGLLTPFVGGISTIRRQEQGRLAPR
ncbi:MAG: cytosine permease [Actinomycetota bacterium]